MKARIALAAGVLLASVALAGCGDADGGGSNSGDTATIQEQLDAIIVRLDGMVSRLDFHDETLERTQMLSGSVELESEDLVGLSADVAAASAIDPLWADRTERMLRSMQAVVWPEDDEIKVRAHEIEESLFAALEGFLTGDLAAAQTALASAAPAWTELRHDVFNYVAGPDADHGHSH